MPITANQLAEFFIVIFVVKNSQVRALVTHLNINITINIGDIQQFLQVIGSDIAFFFNIFEDIGTFGGGFFVGFVFFSNVSHGSDVLYVVVRW